MTPFRLIGPMLLAAAVCGCAREEPAANTSVDIDRAAREAQGSINAYNETVAVEQDRDTPAPSPTPTASPAPLDPPAPGTPGGLPDDRTPLSEAPSTPDSAQSAANVVQSYYALIGEGRYTQARALWMRGAAGAGASDAAFAAGFARYAEYRGLVGAPGAIDAGAGQRYVSVPVQIAARLKKGGTPVYEIGSVTLHRTGDIDGATPEQRSWHVQRIDLKPAPSATQAPAQRP